MITQGLVLQMLAACFLPATSLAQTITARVTVERQPQDVRIVQDSPEFSVLLQAELERMAQSRTVRPDVRVHGIVSSFGNPRFPAHQDYCGAQTPTRVPFGIRIEIAQFDPREFRGDGRAEWSRDLPSYTQAIQQCQGFALVGECGQTERKVREVVLELGQCRPAGVR